MLYGVTDKGFVKKRINDIEKSIEDRMRSRGYTNFSINPYSIEGSLLGVISHEFVNAWNGIQESYNSRYLDLCEGAQLDNHGKNHILPRILGKNATTTLRFTAESEIVVPKGTLVRIRDTNLNFKTVLDLKIDDTLKGEVQAIALQTGTDYNTNPNTITEMVNTVVGISSVTNIIPATGGDGVEQDDPYREALKIAGRSKGGSTVDAITIELRKLPEVNGALVLENVGDEIDENGVDPGKIKVFIEGIATENVAKALHKYGAFGINTQGDITYDIKNDGGQMIPVNYNMFNPVPVYVRVVLLSSEKSSNALKESIIKNVEDYVRTSNYLEGRKVVHNQLEAKAYNADADIIELEAFSGLDQSNLNKESIKIPSGSLFYAVVEVVDGPR
ncbi:MAG: baseplate J/gp47 family protein [Cetobacterium sp.]|uniref:baseplate J/gp47 family protein n=1 Tax=Cetobacterium sp. TaxID=2071632 RepID=UPI003EE6F78C